MTSMTLYAFIFFILWRKGNKKNTILQIIWSKSIYFNTIYYFYYTDIITFDYDEGDVQNDKGPGEREQMEAAENAALALR